ncbi:hypothetical protein DAPPUDRAFT_240864 [Daphnia pulex]|uniref:Uncharacterized protein n=1 Tax=Daphnia pulex TaxID=6669 RepID=E9GCS5_DAPPU|nr:hypothetical protein DAPPUDRAFT_240864 [Daphnia pulex]|eukprot:EFX82609.1 hypothetical protein DAPPUDRAFT_240864 [Daphnia pulex]
MGNPPSSCTNTAPFFPCALHSYKYTWGSIVGGVLLSLEFYGRQLAIPMVQPSDFLTSEVQTLVRHF